MGLLDFFVKEGGKFLKDAMPGGLLNPEVSAQSAFDGAAIASSPVPVLGDLLGLGADLHRYAKQPEERTAGNFALTGLGMLPFVPAMTAWHGSPHKFDKFSLDKIGTGEGAQAYGHGLYLAEAPAVAQEYAGALSAAKATKPVGNVDLTQAYQNLPNDVPETLLAARRDFRALTDAGELSTADRRDFLTAVNNNLAASKNGQLYKTDIPDEAVARFLDWDKPLSQQAPEVLAKARAAIDSVQGDGFYDEYAKGGADLRDLLYNLDEVPAGGFENLFKQQGIPGIRYLDGGSRSAGQGSSNFVAFDPEMIRILERNGQPTGLQPWQPGEYKLGDLLK